MGQLHGQLQASSGCKGPRTHLPRANLTGPTGAMVLYRAGIATRAGW